MSSAVESRARPEKSAGRSGGTQEATQAPRVERHSTRSRAGVLSFPAVQGDAREREHHRDAREADLAREEEQAVHEGGDPAVLAELADERDMLADERDDAARERDEAALTRRSAAQDRDVRAAKRDQRRRAEHDDNDPGFPDRFLSARDVDASAGDRAEALGDERHADQDRQRSREDRHRAAADRKSATHAAAAAADEAEAEQQRLRAALASRSIIGQAQGILVARLRITADEAFELLVRESQAKDVELHEVAAMHVKDAGGTVGH